MTAQKAKELSLKVWRYFARHPEIHCKKDLPKELYLSIKGFVCSCPLCELFIENIDIVHFSHPCCLGCPLDSCFKTFGLYSNWYNSTSNLARRKHAQKIVDAIEEWFPD